MTYVYYTLIACYVLICLATLPAFGRLLQNKSEIFDSVKTCCALLAASIINNFIARGEEGWALQKFSFGSIITGVCFVMLLVVIHRTEKALHGGES